MRRFFSALRRLIATRLVSGAMAKLSMFASNKFLLASAALLWLHHDALALAGRRLVDAHGMDGPALFVASAFLFAPTAAGWLRQMSEDFRRLPHEAT